MGYRMVIFWWRVERKGVLVREDSLDVVGKEIVGALENFRIFSCFKCGLRLVVWVLFGNLLEM